MKLSMIIPCYNVENFIDKCVNSCLSSSHLEKNDYEIILVNDGSTDSTYKKILKYSHLKNVKIINRKNGGLSIARNTGLKHARGKYIWFIDSDDYVIINNFKELIKFLNESDDDLIAFESLFVMGDTKFRKNRLNKSSDCILIGNNKRKIKLQGVWNNFFLRSFINNYNLIFRPITHEDVEFMTRTLILSKSIRYINKIYFVHLLSRSGSITFKRSIKNSLNLIICSKYLNQFYLENKKINNIDFAAKRACASLFRAVDFSFYYKFSISDLKKLKCEVDTCVKQYRGAIYKSLSFSQKVKLNIYNIFGFYFFRLFVSYLMSLKKLKIN